MLWGHSAQRCIIFSMSWHRENALETRTTVWLTVSRTGITQPRCRYWMNFIEAAPASLVLTERPWMMGRGWRRICSIGCEEESDDEESWLERETARAHHTCVNRNPYLLPSSHLLPPNIFWYSLLLLHLIERDRAKLLDIEQQYG